MGGTRQEGLLVCFRCPFVFVIVWSESPLPPRAGSQHPVSSCTMNDSVEGESGSGALEASGGELSSELTAKGGQAAPAPRPPSPQRPEQDSVPLSVITERTTQRASTTV